MSKPAERFLAAYDVSDAVATTVDADVDIAWDALMGVDLLELGRRRSLVGVLGAARMLPQMLRDLVVGKGLPDAPGSLTLRQTAADPDAEGSWLLLGDEERELALGLVGRFWRPVIRYARLKPGEFEAFDEPGWAKTVYALSATELGDGRTLLRGEMRTATTDERSRRWFRRYWTLGVGSGAHVLVNALLERASEIAEA